jgi:hypothetical protein
LADVGVQPPQFDPNGPLPLDGSLRHGLSLGGSPRHGTTRLFIHRSLFGLANALYQRPQPFPFRNGFGRPIAVPEVSVL